MAIGVSPHGIAYPDSPAGAGQWAEMSGAHPMSPLVGGPGYDATGSNTPYQVDGGRSRIVSNDAQLNIGPAAGGRLLDDWRDVFNWKGSPIPWLLLLTLVMVGFAHFRVQARVGKGSVKAALG